MPWKNTGVVVTRVFGVHATRLVTKQNIYTQKDEWMGQMLFIFNGSFSIGNLDMGKSKRVLHKGNWAQEIFQQNGKTYIYIYLYIYGTVPWPHSNGNNGNTGMGT